MNVTYCLLSRAIPTPYSGAIDITGLSPYRVAHSVFYILSLSSRQQLLSELYVASSTRNVTVRVRSSSCACPSLFRKSYSPHSVFQSSLTCLHPVFIRSCRQADMRHLLDNVTSIPTPAHSTFELHVCSFPFYLHPLDVTAAIITNSFSTADPCSFNSSVNSPSHFCRRIE